MKSQDLKNSRAKTGVSRLWLVSARLRGRAQGQPPAQVAIPTEPEL